MYAIPFAFAVALGQGPAESLDDRIARLDSLVAVRLEQLRGLNAKTAVARAFVPIEVGGFRLRVEAAVAGRVQAAAATAWERLWPRGGSWLARELPRLEFDVFMQRGVNAAGRDVEVGIRVEGGDVRRPELTMGAARSGTTQDAIVQSLLQITHRPLSVVTDGLVASDATVQPLPVGLDNVLTVDADPAAPAWYRLRRELALRPSDATRDCLAAELARCLDAMGYTGDRDTWYVPTDYAWLASRRAFSVIARVEEPRRCANGDLDACAALRGALSPDLLTAPVPDLGRMLFLALVLDAGGPDALNRLAATDGDPVSRLRAAAGVPLEQIVERWRMRIVAAEDPERLGPGRLSLASLCAAVVLLAGIRGGRP